MCDCEIKVVDKPTPQPAILVQWLEYIETIFAELTIVEALDVLVELGHQRARYRGADGVLADLTDLYGYPDCLDDPADTFYVEFLGGPPSKDNWGAWFRGTLVTWVVDSVLYDFATNEGSLAMPVIQECEAFINDAEDDDEYNQYDDWEAGSTNIRDF